MPYRDPIRQKKAQHDWYVRNKQLTRMRARESMRKGRPKRAAKWEAEFITCNKHLEKRCVKWRYITSGVRKCYFCVKQYPSYHRYRTSTLGKERKYWARVALRKRRKLEESKI